MLKFFTSFAQSKFISIRSIYKALLIAVGFVFLFSSCYKTTHNEPESTQELVIVTSFYPMYLHTINIAKDVPEVKVINMTEPQTGCLHDYQLSVSDMKLLEKADIFVINGAGMEGFLEKVIKQNSKVKIAEASKGIELLKEDFHHNHKHDEEDNHDHEDEDKDEHENEHYNPHVWVSISGAIQQVRNIADQLSEYDSKNSQLYKQNADAYIEKLEGLKTEMHSRIKNLPNRKIITFHEAFPYFAKEFSLEIAAVIQREPGTEPGAGELKETVEIIKKTGIKALFAEPQYSSKAADIISRETGAKIYLLDPIVTGEAKPDQMNAYIDRMKQNLKVLEEALK
jgi:zinc transport system substrate-binding protein